MKRKVTKIKGASMTEYVLLVGLIAAAAIVALTAVGTDIAAFFTGMSDTITGATPGGS
jgi:Flp pilus assembly pilin Flp